MSSVQFSSVFQACKEKGGDYWHGQTTVYYKDGMLEKSDHKMVLLWSGDKQFDRELYKTFQSKIEVCTFSEKTPTTSKVEPGGERRCVSLTPTKKSTQNVSKKSPSISPESYELNITKVKEQAESFRNEKKRERLSFQDNVNRKKAKSVEHLHFTNHFSTSNSKSSDRNSNNINESVRVEKGTVGVFSETGSLIHTAEFMEGDTYEGILIASCQKLEEELGHQLNFRSFSLYDRLTKQEVNMTGYINPTIEELILRMVKDGDRTITNLLQVADTTVTDSAIIEQTLAVPTSEEKKRERDNEDDRNYSDSKATKII